MRPSSITLVALLSTLASSALPAGAQRRREPPEPKYWLSVSTGYLWLPEVRDGATLSTWHFGDAFPVGVALEKSLRGDMSLGLAFARARVPLTYRSESLGRRSAHATVASYGPVLRIRRGAWDALGATLELQPGIVQYGNFQDDLTGEPLPPERANRDFAFTMGYVWSVRFRVDWAFEFGSNVILVFHDRTGLEGDERSLNRHSLLRLAVRLGF
jgi:hypothetical protein